MEPSPHPASHLALAARGFGPLLQRDYWAVLRRCRLPPSRLIARVAAWFPAFAPEPVVVFKGHPGRALEPGAELEVDILGAGRCAVQVIHRDAQSFTLATIDGHPEAGRITFGAYRDLRGGVIFHIRSRARSSSRWRYLGWRSAGEVMQTHCWTDFVNRVAVAFGQGVRGHIHAVTRSFPDEPDTRALHAPTFLATGD